MRSRSATVRKVFVITSLLFACSVTNAQLTVVSTSPGMNASNVDWYAPISVTFDRAVNRSTVTSRTFWAFGRYSGTAVGVISFSNGDQTVTLTPDRRFQAGEVVTVFLANSLAAADTSNLRSAGYSWQFLTRVRCGGLNLSQIDSFTNRVANVQTRIYGGITTDFNGDGAIDIATINEVSADMRMFLNRNDGTGLMQPMLSPPLALQDEVSPNETGDFNRDGHADFAVASSNTNNACFALGNGDGTFAPAQFLATSSRPHGVAITDADGDGDVDVLTANSVGSDISLFINDGNGVFSSGGAFEGGCDGEYGLIAADMTQDGILDVVVGCQFGEQAVVMRGNGDGTFTPMTPQSIGGECWVINAADVNGDGFLDIISGNSFNANGAILMGDGAGGLAAPVTYPAPGHTPSTDVGDLDGDGDLDWVLSSFGGGAWRIYRNLGNGTFQFVQDIPAPSNPSCSALADLDNDGDLDIVLFDEIADVVILYENTVDPPLGDIDLDGDVDLSDLAGLLAAFGTCDGDAGFNPGADLDDSGCIDLGDLAGLLSEFGTTCGPL
ncbi:MAG: VCBS repeat-containing protein [Phycisphaerales bacterium]|nr:VCBS repeat-containing protein [Phycisphaerales bacterium]